MSYRVCGHLRETLSEAGYSFAVTKGDGEYYLVDKEGAAERWVVQPDGVAAYAVVLDGNELEFVSSIPSPYSLADLVKEEAA
jgi:hypothetical protein